MIPRIDDEEALRSLLKRYPVVGILGPRQVGKTTLARSLGAAARSFTYFDLENPAHAAQLAEPQLALESLRGLIVIDEIQRAPALFQVLRVLADRRPIRARFLLLGSASPHLIKGTSETLAGRIAYYELGGLSISDVNPSNIERLWLRGGFPRAYLAANLAQSTEWRQDFVRTFLERDIPQLGIAIASPALRRFWVMLAHYHAQKWNSSELSRAFGVSDTAIRRYLDVLTSTLVVRQLQPWYENISKRQVKAPKVYIRDSGILHALLGLATMADLNSHPKIGASWEGFVIEQLLRKLKARPEECYFWSTHSGAEVDLLVMRGRKRVAFEIKRTTAPKITPAMRIATNDLNLTQLDLIHAGENTFPLDKGIRAVSVHRLLQDVHPL